MKIPLATGGLMIRFLKSKAIPILIIICIILSITTTYFIYKYTETYEANENLFISCFDVSNEISAYINNVNNDSEILSQWDQLLEIETKLTTSSKTYANLNKTYKSLLDFISAMQLYTWALEDVYLEDRYSEVDFNKIVEDLSEAMLLLKDTDKSGNLDQFVSSFNSLMSTNSAEYFDADNQILFLYQEFQANKQLTSEDFSLYN